MTKTKHILGLHFIVPILINDCTICLRRLKRFCTSSEGRIHSHNLTFSALNLVLHLDILGPLHVRTRYNLPTRNEDHFTSKLYVIVAVCAVSRLVTLAVVGSRKVHDINLGLRAIFSRSGVPWMIFVDNESSFHKINREGTIGVQENNNINNYCVPFYFVPPTARAHQANSIVERKIRSIRETVGSLNFGSTNMDIPAVTNFIQLAEEHLNNVPCGLRKQGDRYNILGQSPHLQFISPSSFLGALNQRRPIGLISLDNSVDDCLKQQKAIVRNLTCLMSGYFTFLQREGKHSFDQNAGTLVQNDIVAFKLSEGTFHASSTCWRYGMITNIHCSDFDGRSRVVSIRYTGLPGDVLDKAVLQGPKIINTRRMQSQCIKLVDSTHDFLKTSFCSSTNYVENLLNYPSGGVDITPAKAVKTSTISTSKPHVTDRQTGGNKMDPAPEHMDNAELADHEVGNKDLLPNCSNNREAIKPAPTAIQQDSRKAKHVPPSNRVLRSHAKHSDTNLPVLPADNPSSWTTKSCDCCSIHHASCALVSLIVASCLPIVQSIATSLLLKVFAIFLITSSTSTSLLHRHGCSQFLLASKDSNVSGIYYRSIQNVEFDTSGKLQKSEINKTNNLKIGNIYSRSDDVRDYPRLFHSSQVLKNFIFMTNVKDKQFISHFFLKSASNISALEIPLRNWTARNMDERLFCFRPMNVTFLEENYEQPKLKPFLNEKIDIANLQALRERRDSPVEWKTINEGSSFHLKCENSTHENVIKTSWRRYLQDESVIALPETGHTLTFDTINISHQGFYQCLIRTTLGKLSIQNFGLHVRKTSLSLPSSFLLDPSIEQYNNFEGFDCASEKNKAILIDLRNDMDCNIQKYSAYKEPKLIPMAIIHTRISEPVTMVRCHLEVETASSICGAGIFSLKKFSHANGGLFGLMENIEISPESCKNAFLSGSFSFQLGPQKINMIIKSEMSGKYGINTFLCGSILHSNGTCSGADSIPCYRNKLNPADEPIGQILQLRGTLTISKVAALAVLEDKIIIVSQFSTEFAINSKESATHVNEYGTFITIGRLNLQKYELVIIAKSTILEPKESDNPPIFSFDLQFQSGKRRVGLIGGDQFLVNRELCYTTQFYNFHICNNSSNLDFSQNQV